MDLIYQISLVIEFILSLISTVESLILLILFILIVHLMLYFIRDKKHLDALRNFEDTTGIKIEDFQEFPLINIIIPAWNEGEIFRNCLSNIFTLKYPRLKVIANVGGKKETIDIAKSFKNHKNFEIFYQTKGEGKIKAINDCFSQVKEGLICLIDADVYLVDEDLLNMLYVIKLKKGSVIATSLKPHYLQVKNFFVRYLFINRNTPFRIIFSRYERNVITQCTLIKLEVIDQIGKFTEKKLIDDGQTMGRNITEKNYKIYQLNSQGVQSFNYPDKLKNYASQNVRWTQNSYFNVVIKSKKRILIFILSSIKALYYVIFPFLLIVNTSLFLIGVLLLIDVYMNKIRKILFFRKTSDKSYYGKTQIWFYFGLFFFIYLDSLIRIYTVLELILKGDKNFRKRKNIE